MENIGSNFEVVGMAEWFVPAIVSYQAMHNKLQKIKNIAKKEMIDFLDTKTLSMDSKKPVAKGFWNRKSIKELQIIYSAVKASELEGNIFDVTTLHKRTLKGIDLLTYSFPCQDLSHQGKQKGMSKDAGTRSGLLWEIEKALDATKQEDMPRYLVMENVVALMSKVNEEELNKWMHKLNTLGYINDISILNAAHFGSSQARKRVFMISTLGDKKVHLPTGNKKPKSISRILNRQAIQGDYMNELLEFPILNWSKTNSNINKGKLIGYSSFNSEAFVYDPKFTGPTLTASGANSRIKLIYEGNIRKMNAKEAFRYMGFKAQDFHKVNRLKYLNESQMIYTCGNSISVEVMNEIMRNINDDWKVLNNEY